MSQVTPVAERRATYADLEAVPGHLVAEILEGELVTTPRPGSRHALASSQLLSSVGPAFGRGAGGPGGWWLLSGPELHLGDDVVVPDLAGWRKERMPEFPDVAFFEVVPDWVCEVLSLSTEALDRGRKLRIYGRNGVQYVWFLNPTARMLEILVRQEGRWVVQSVHTSDAVVRAEPFDAVELELPQLCGEERPHR